MRQQRSNECFHKIVAFQNHPNCSHLASLCENACQAIHPGNFRQVTVDATAVSGSYKNIKKCFVEAIKSFTDKMSRAYDEMMRQHNKNFTERLREMEKELLACLMKNVAINKDVLQKIENDRMQKLRCSEINSFMQDTANIEQKVKSAPLEPIYAKHLNILKKDQEESSQWKGVMQNYQAQIEKYKAEIESLEKIKLALQKQVGKLREEKRKNLKIKTWGILKVVAKKKMRSKKGNERQEISNIATDQHMPIVK